MSGEKVTYYKAVRPDGTDFRTGTIRYDVGATVTHPNPHGRDASGYLSVATIPTGCAGMTWPARLLQVTADEVWEDPHFPNKRCTHSLTVVAEVDPLLALGPQGREIVALIERAGALTVDEARALAAAWAAAWAARAAARAAAGAAARAAARAAAGVAAWAAAGAAARAAGAAAGEAAGDAAGALVVRDLIGSHGFTQAHYDTLTGPWRTVIGPLHPDDAPIPSESRADS